MELEWSKNNKYINYILHPKVGFFKRLIFKYKLKKILGKMSPSFNEMKLIAGCLYFLDTIYLFENDAEITSISGMVRPKRGESTIVTKVNSTQTVIITLRDPDTITIEILNRGKLRSKISFADGCAEVNDILDEILFLNINNYLMDAFTKILFKYI